jgi:hypothetical protein
LVGTVATSTTVHSVSKTKDVAHVGWDAVYASFRTPKPTMMHTTAFEYNKNRSLGCLIFNLDMRFSIVQEEEQDRRVEGAQR